MRRSIKCGVAVFFIVATILILSPIIARGQAKDPNVHGFIIYVRTQQFPLNGIQQQYVNAEELGNLLGLSIRSMDGGKSIMVNHLFYDKDVRAYNGKAFIKPKLFFDLFDMPSTMINSFTFRLESSSVPFFDTAFYRFQGEGTVKVENKDVKTNFLMIKTRKFVGMEPIVAAIHGTSNKDSRGMLTVNGRRVDRWIQQGDVTYANIDDLAKAIGKSIK